MVWTSEVRPSALADLRVIYRYLLGVHHERLGNDFGAAHQMATRRLDKILDNISRLEQVPRMGTRVRIHGADMRHVTIDRAIYWFTLDEAAQVLRVEAIFFGGQDHLERMFARLMGEAPKDLP